MARSRRQRLWDRLAAGDMRNVGFAEFCRLVKAFGFELRRVSRSHYIYTHPQALAAHPATAATGGEAVLDRAIPGDGQGIRTEDGAAGMTPKYHINLFWSEADGAWAADVPDLRSCSAFGDRRAEALAEVERAMDAWLAVARDAGLPIPEPQYGAKGQVTN